MKNGGTTGASAPVKNKSKAKPASVPAEAEKPKAETPASAKTAEKAAPASRPTPAASRQGATRGDSAAAQPKAAPSQSAPTAARPKAALAASAKADKTPAAKPTPATRAEPKAPASPAPKAKAEEDKQAATPASKPTHVPAKAVSDKPVKHASAEPALVKPEPTPSGGAASKPEATTAPLATAARVGAETTRTAYAQVQQSSETLHQAVAGNTTAMTSGLAEINSKVFDIVRAQAEAALDVWRSTLTARSPAEAMQAQMNAVQRAYQDTTQRWKDLFETANRVAGVGLKPQRSFRDKDAKR